jgi:hypothetical protein
VSRSSALRTGADGGVEGPGAQPTPARLLRTAVLTGIVIAAGFDVVLMIIAFVVVGGRADGPFNPLFLLLYLIGLIVGALCGVTGWLLWLAALRLTAGSPRARTPALGIAAFLGYGGAFIGAVVVLFGGVQSPLIELLIAAVYGAVGALALLGAWNRGSALGYLRRRRANP